MNEWLVSVLVGMTLCFMLLLLVLLSLGAYHLLIGIRRESRIHRRAQQDYRAARGTQHFRQLCVSLPVLSTSLKTRQARIKNLEEQLDFLKRERSAELDEALSRYLVNERLAKVPGIGPALSHDIIHYCFRGSLRDLRFASRVRRVGPSRQSAIMAWVYAMESEFPLLLAGDFPGKQYVLDKYAEQERSLQMLLKSEQTAFESENRLFEEAYAVASRFRGIKTSHFHRALKRNTPKSPVPEWYFVGVYPPWEPMPEWFETLLRRYGG